MPDSIRFAEFRVGGREVLTDGDRVGWWDATTGKPLRSLAAISEKPIYANSLLSTDDKRLFFIRSLNKEGKFSLIERDLTTNRDRVLNDSLPYYYGRPEGSPDGTRLAIPGLSTLKVFILDAATGMVLHELNDHKQYVDNVIFSPDGNWIASFANDATGRGDHDIRLWDATTGKLVNKLLPTRGSAFQCTFTPDGRHLLSIGGEPGIPNKTGEAHVWEIATGKLVKMWIAHAERGVAIAVSPDGRSVLTTSLDRTVKLWDFPSGLLKNEFKGHSAYVRSISFSPDGRRFLACSGDAPCFVWDVYGHLTATVSLLSDKETARVWDDLSSDDPAIGFKSVCRLAVAGDSGVALLKAKMKPLQAPEAAKIDQLLADLKSPRFAIRDKASADLSRVADQNEPRLKKALEAETDANVRDQLGKLIAAAETESLDSRRGRRAVEALEVIGTADAKRLAEVLAKGDPAGRLTKEAKGTVGRMK
jgi:dipeptidyl aminopeptidase/acylaminoacyl peptidase